MDCTRAFLDHAIGRLRYSSGDTLAAVQMFAALLRPNDGEVTVVRGGGGNAESGAMYLADFRDALEVSETFIDFFAVMSFDSLTHSIYSISYLPMKITLLYPVFIFHSNSPKLHLRK